MPIDHSHSRVTAQRIRPKQLSERVVHYHPEYVGAYDSRHKGSKACSAPKARTQRQTSSRRVFEDRTPAYEGLLAAACIATAYADAGIGDQEVNG